MQFSENVVSKPPYKLNLVKSRLINLNVCSLAVGGKKTFRILERFVVSANGFLGENF